MTHTREDAQALIARLDAAAKGLRSFYKVGAVELIPAATMTEAAALIRALLDELDKLRAERDRFEAALARACLVGATTYLIERAEAAYARLAAVEAERDRMREALTDLLNAACGPVGFAEAVRHHSGKAYPWPSLDAAEEKARAALTATPANEGKTP